MKCESCAEKMKPEEMKTCCARKMCQECLIEHFEERHRDLTDEGDLNAEEA